MSDPNPLTGRDRERHLERDGRCIVDQRGPGSISDYLNPNPVFDTTTGQSVPATGQPYTGPVSGIQYDYVNITSDSLNISASTPNWFIIVAAELMRLQLIVASMCWTAAPVQISSLGAAERTRSSWMIADPVPTSGARSIIFIQAMRQRFGALSRVTLIYPWVDGQGATGYTGLTLHATAAGVPTASLTLVGFTSTDMTDAKLSVSFGTTAASGGVPGSAYMYVHANS